jgi:hypothetical protein
MKNGVFWDVGRASVTRTDVSEELSALFIGITRVDELGPLALTSNRRKLRRNTWYFFAACVGC